jgi:hypothetical protein
MAVTVAAIFSAALRVLVILIALIILVITVIFLLRCFLGLALCSRLIWAIFADGRTVLHRLLTVLVRAATVASTATAAMASAALAVSTLSVTALGTGRVISCLRALLLDGRAGRGEITGAHRDALSVIFLAGAVFPRVWLVFLIHKFSVSIGLFFYQKVEIAK